MSIGGAGSSLASQQINRTFAKSQAPEPRVCHGPVGRAETARAVGPLSLPHALPIGLEPAQDVGHAGDGPGVGEEQGGADQLGVVRMEDDGVLDAFEPGVGDGHGPVARAVGQLIQQGGQVGGRRLGQPAEQAGVRVLQAELLLDPPRASAVSRPLSPATM